MVGHLLVKLSPIDIQYTHSPLCNSLFPSSPSPYSLFSDPFFMLQSIFSHPFAMVYCNSPIPAPFSECITLFSLSLFCVLLPLCHIIYSSHPCSRSLLSLSWVIHLSLLLNTTLQLICSPFLCLRL